MDNVSSTSMKNLPRAIIVVLAVQTLLTLAFLGYCAAAHGMRPIMRRLFQQPVIPLACSIALLAIALIEFVTRKGWQQHAGLLTWSIVDIAVRIVMCNGHVSSNSDNWHVSFGFGVQAYFLATALLSAAILITSARRVRCLT